jgi:hypothetical protein
VFFGGARGYYFCNFELLKLHTQRLRLIEMMLKYHTKQEAIVEISSIIVLIITSAVPCLLIKGIAGIATSIILTLISLYFLAIFWMAPNNVNVTIVEEGTAKHIYKGGDCVDAIFALKGHVLLDNYDVISLKDFEERVKKEKIKIKEDSPWHRLVRRWVGVRWIGIWPLYRIPFKPFSWTSLREDGKEISKTEDHDYILIRRDVYLGKQEKVEGADNIPIDWKYLVEFQIINLMKPVIEVQNWLEVGLVKIKGYLRDENSKYSFDQLISRAISCVKSVPEDVLSPACQKNLSAIMMGDWEKTIIPSLHNDYGIKLNDFNIIDVNPDPRYRALTTKIIEAEKRKRAIEIAAEAEAYKRSTETTGLLMSMLSQLLGMSKKEIQKEMRENPNEFKEKYGSLMDSCNDILVRAMTISSGKLVDVRTPDSKGLTGDLLSLLITSRLIDTDNRSIAAEQGGKKTNNKKKGRKGESDDEEGDEDESMWDDLQNQGLPIDDIK